MWNIKALALTVRKLWAWLKIFKDRSNSNVKVTVSKIMVPMKGLATSNTHVKYQSPSTYCSKVIIKVKVFKKWVNVWRIRCFYHPWWPKIELFEFDIYHQHSRKNGNVCFMYFITCVNLEVLCNVRYCYIFTSRQTRTLMSAIRSSEGPHTY